MPTNFTNHTRYEDILNKYGHLNLPRHTSYPAANVWRTIDKNDGNTALQEFFQLKRATSLYIHAPYCQSLCYYCGCNKEVIGPMNNKNFTLIKSYEETISTELQLLASVIEPPTYEQIHFGGGTPNYLPNDTLIQIMSNIEKSGEISSTAEIAFEIDPRLSHFENLSLLRKLGCNRLSMGIQEFDPLVQETINRIQPYEMVAKCVGDARSLGIRSINFDLIYGLPKQTLGGFEQTIEKTLRLGPDRISLFRLAVIPEIFKWQKTFKQGDMPSQKECLAMFLLAITQFRENGYVYIGLDHFAKPTDPLALAYQNNTLHRNFQGMAPEKALPILGIGPSAISQFGPAYLQNTKSIREWKQDIQSGTFAHTKGWILSPADENRREIIQRIYCQGEFNIDIETLANEDPNVLYAAKNRVKELIDDGLVTQIKENHYRLTDPLGRILARVVAAIFDPYVPPDQWQGSSKRIASQVL